MTKKIRNRKDTAEIRKAAKTVMYVPNDPGDEPLDLTKAEKLRTTAPMMAIQYVEKTICNDSEMYRALRQDGKHLVPATTPHVITSAMQFEQFLLGNYRAEAEKVERPVEALEAPADDATLGVK